MNRLTERHVVVVVDDEPGILSAIRRTLRNEPYQVLTTERPEQALRWVESRDVSAVVSDQRMPGMNGMDVLRKVGERSPSTARIILTAFMGPTTREPGLRGAADSIVGKPWDDRLLRRMIREFLSEREWEARGSD
jgi:response regulator RpfG family c-di-GMP phosphodiesterase